MTIEETNNKIPLENQTKLSIQVSLNGLSFCVFDTTANAMLQCEIMVFTKQLTPYDLLKSLKQFFQEHRIDKVLFSEVVVVHRNNLFGFVPKPFFLEDELADYLKYNIKTLVNDHIAHDEITPFELIMVYVPFVNINNYIYELFGAFTFKHHGTVMVESLLNRSAQHNDDLVHPSEGIMDPKEPVCYVYIFESQLDITIIAQNKLLLYNTFGFVTKEDFLYYLLFTLEQLKLDTATLAVRFFGDIEEDDDIYGLCYRYIQNLTIFSPSSMEYPLSHPREEIIDFNLPNAL